MGPNLDPPPCLTFDDPALATALLLDVRRATAFAAADAMLPGASWHDPADVAHWLKALPMEREIVVYCVHGHEVSQGVAQHLRNAGYRAHYLEGGIAGWTARGGSLQAKLR